MSTALDLAFNHLITAKATESIVRVYGKDFARHFRGRSKRT